MEEKEIKKLIQQVFDERINSALTRLTNEYSGLDTRKDLETKEGSEERKVLQNRLDRLDLLIEIFKNFKHI